MKYPSPADVVEMKARGYDTSTIAEAEEQSKKWSIAQELCRAIEVAFAGVTLGAGVGLREGRALDDYADAETCAAYRAEDEKDDWRRITATDLHYCRGSLSFFDAEGMRFHLPAFLIDDLSGDGDPITVHLIDSYEGQANHRAGQFALLSPKQRATVRAYLQVILSDRDGRTRRDEIERALEEYWTAEPSE